MPAPRCERPAPSQVPGSLHRGIAEAYHTVALLSSWPLPSLIGRGLMARQGAAMKYIVTLAAILVLIATAGCYGGMSLPPTYVRILNHSQECERSATGDYCTCYVRGAVANMGEYAADEVDVSVEWYDANGALLGEASEPIFDLRPGQSAHFELMYQQRGCPSRYEIWVEWS